MKRRAFALSAGLLLLGLVPGSALAGPVSAPTVVDQSAPTGTTSTGGLLTQTFTAGITGPLSAVDLNFAINGTTTVTVKLEGVQNVGGQEVPDGNALATTSQSITGADSSTQFWVHFTFPTPVNVTANHMYAIVFDAGTAGAFGTATDSYAGGAAWASPQGNWIPIGNFGDFGFNTYIVDTVTTTLQWDPTQVTAGTQAALQLTATMKFTDYDGDGVSNFTAALVLPSWFSPTQVGCTDLATPGNFTVVNCTLANLTGTGIEVPNIDPGDTLTFVLTGTAPADVETASAVGTGCLVRSLEEPQGQAQPNPVLAPYCVDGSASVSVVAPTPTPSPSPVSSLQGATLAPSPTQAPTPPPTSTGSGSSSDNGGGAVWFLPFGLVAFFGGLLILVDRRRRQIF